MKRPPSSSKPLADIRKNWKAREAQSFRDVPGVPVDDQGAPITNLHPDALTGQGSKVMAAGEDIDDSARLVATYGGAAQDWEKVKSAASAGLDLHAYRNKQTSRVEDIKTKQLDEPKQPLDRLTPRQSSSGPKEQAATPTASKSDDFKENNQMTEEKNRFEALKAKHQDNAKEATTPKPQTPEERTEALMAKYRDNAKDATPPKPRTAEERTEALMAKYRDNAKDAITPKPQTAKERIEALEARHRDNAKDIATSKSQTKEDTESIKTKFRDNTPDITGQETRTKQFRDNADDITGSDSSGDSGGGGSGSKRTEKPTGPRLF